MVHAAGTGTRLPGVTRALVAALVAVAALLAAGCGGEPEAQSWAGDVCDELNEWTEELRGIAQDAEAEGDVLETYRERIDAAEDATRDLAEDLADLGPPETEAGTEIEEELQTLADDLRARLALIRTQTEELQAGSLSAFLEGLAAIAEEVESAGAEIRASLDRIGELDPAGELRDGFEEADSCRRLRETLGTDES